MPEQVPPERVLAIAAAARIPLAPASAARVADAVSPAVTRFAAAQASFSFETEPASFVAVQRRKRAP